MIKRLIRSTKTHENILVTLASLEQGDSYSLFFDLAKYNLWEYFMDKRVSIESFGQRTEVFSQTIGLAGALAFLHEELISGSSTETYHCYHLDLKPHNILVFESDGRHIWKISDFGISKIKRVETNKIYSLDNIFVPDNANAHKVLSSGVTNPRYGDTYGAPEARHQGNRINREVDVWSFGCVIVLVLTYMNSQSTGITEFQEARERNRNDDRFYGPAKSSGGSDIKYILHHSVQTWLKFLVSQAKERSNHEGSVTENVSNLLHYQILCPDPSKRLPAKHIEAHLQRIYKLFSRPPDPNMSQA